MRLLAVLGRQPQQLGWYHQRVLSRKKRKVTLEAAAESEIRQAINQLNNGKSPGIVTTSQENYGRHLEKKGVHALLNLCVKIWNQVE